MEQVTKDRIIDKAAKDIRGEPGSLSVLIRTLQWVFSEGYAYGLSQGHADNNTEGG